MHAHEEDGYRLDRRLTGAIFRERLAEAMHQSAMNQSDLARSSGIDRSTLSQLLSGKTDRLPRAETVARMAVAMKVGLDWLMGLSNDARPGARIIRESVQIAHSESTQPTDENITRWHAEAAGAKIRYVPSSLPDLMKSDAVLAHEYGDYAAKSPGQAKTASAERLAYSRMPESDMEVCFSVQALSSFARGEGVWSGLPAAERRRQLEKMSDLAEELYPRLRVILFDGLRYYAVPYTVFGTRRAAVFMGQMYFVFNTAEHVGTLIQHFDNLIRAADIHAHEFAAHARMLAATSAL